MTIKQAIDIVDAIKPNQYSRTVKAQWARNIERRVHNEIYLNHEHEDIEFTLPTEEDGEEYALFAPAPYDELYLLYLAAQIDSANAEYGRYNNTVRQFDSVYRDFEKFWQSGHMPCPLNLIKY
ncbi:MAG: hypothetical protein J1E39_10005 [Eubacterium sp.]|nr:hypothetical protein [Eubacterium sp.]